MSCTTYQFDRTIDRRGTGAVKTDSLKERFGRDDLIPLWIADMDFETPACVVETIRKRCDHALLGYTKPLDSYYEAILRWIDRRYGMSDVSCDEIGFVSGIVPALAFCIKAFTHDGDRIMIQSPVYPPFHNLTINNHRTLICNSLRIEQGRYEIDFDDFESKLKEVKLFILCNPHNPGGRVWTREELQRMAELCYRHGVLVISDEIHADLTLYGRRHIPFASVSDEARNNSITLMAPSKTFNMAGLSSSYYIIFNVAVRELFKNYLADSELANGHLFAFCAAETAYNEGEPWLKAVLSYIESNVDYVCSFLDERLPQIKAMRPDASFLLWLDCRAMGLNQAQLVDFFVNKARLALNDGALFGKEGVGYMRMNIACPRTVLEQALTQLEEAFTH